MPHLFYVDEVPFHSDQGPRYIVSSEYVLSAKHFPAYADRVPDAVERASVTEVEAAKKMAAGYGRTTAEKPPPSNLLLKLCNKAGVSPKFHSTMFVV